MARERICRGDVITGESSLDLGRRQTVLHSYRFEGKDMLSLSPRHQATSIYVVAETTTQKPSTTLGELETQVYYCSRPRGVNAPSSEPPTKVTEFLYMDST